MITFKTFLTEKSLFNPDVSWVNRLVKKIHIDDLYDVDELIDELNELFASKKIEFELETKPNFGSGAFKDKAAAAVGISGGEFVGLDSDPKIIINISKKAFTAFEDPRFVEVLKDTIKHELIHELQTKASKTKDLGGSDDDDVDYYKDPQEIGALASEIESQLLRIEPNVDVLIRKIQKADKSLEKSDAWRLYLLSYREDPQGFKKAYNRMVSTIVQRLQQHKNKKSK